MKSKILFICKKRTDVTEYNYNYGSVGLMNSAAFVANYLNDLGVDSKVVMVVDANGIDKEVFAYQPTHVVIEALWVTPDKIKELLGLKRYSGINWIVRLHSKVSFIANEGIAFQWIVGYSNLMEENSNLFISVNSKEFVEDLENIFHINGLYLPNIYHPVETPKKVSKIKKDHLDIACMGAIRPMKNHLIQAIAAIEYGEETDQVIHFHINGDRLEQSGANVYKNIKALFEGTRHKLIEEPWLSHPDFIDLVRTMDLGLQVSFSETFNIVAADFISNDIPMIGSFDITWMPKIFRANPCSSVDILDKMFLIMDTKEFGLFKLNKIHLDRYNRKAKKIWKDYVLFGVN